MKYICFPLLVLLLLIFAPYGAAAQNAPVTTATTIGDATPGTVTIPVTVTDFTFIGAISLTLEFDGSVLQFIQGIKNPLLPGIFIVTDNDQGNGYHRLVMGWFGNGISLPDGSSIIDLEFTYTDGITLLEWIDLGGSCEYADGNYIPLNDIPTSDFYINGHVCGIMGAPGPVTGDTAVCHGQSGVIYSIQPVANATGYSWSVPPGADIVSGQGTSSISVDYATNATSGLVEVLLSNPCGSEAVSQLPVQVSELPVAGAGDDFTMNYGTSATLQAAPGGTGSYSYHWSPEELLIDPNVQNPQTVIMTSSAVFTLLVTNLETLCENSDQVMVTITGGPLSVDPIASPPEVCHGFPSQLFSNAGGGSGEYTYQWVSNPPGWSSSQANPVVLPQVSTQYLLTVNDGYTSVEGSAFVSVLSLPTAIISGGDTLCGEEEYATLQIDLTGTPPWSFIYNYGSTSVQVTNQQTSPFTFNTNEPGDYTVTSVEDLHCNGLTYGTAIVRKYPIPGKPEITINNMVLTSSASAGNQWYLDDEPIPGATDQTYQVTVSGMYHVVVTLNGCSSEPSDPVDITVGIGENDSGSISIWPNPARDKINIQIAPPITGRLKATLHSPAGSIIHEFDIPGKENTFTLDTSSLPRGLFLLTIRGDNLIIKKKLILQ